MSGVEMAGSPGDNPTDADLRIPPAPQFTPGQIDDLGALLELCAAHPGDRGALEEAIRARFFAAKAQGRATAAERNQQQLRLAGNSLTAMANYGLLDLADVELTDLGDELRALPDNEKRLDRLGQHILSNLYGTDLVIAAQEVLDRGDRVTKATLHEQLARAGFTLPRATTHHTAMGQWLRAAGVLTGGANGWLVDDAKFEALTGVSLKTIDEWSALDGRQRAFLETFRRLAESSGGRAIPATEVMDKAEEEHGRIFKTDQLRKTIFAPLGTGGWIEMSETTKGRGGKSGTITATTKLLETDLERLSGHVVGDIPPDVRAKLGTPLSDIYTGLDSIDAYTKGLALELLAIRLATDLNLSPIRFRQRGVATGGAELDLVAEGAHLHFSRWLFQCKNTTRVRTEDLAREVGMATLLRAHVIVIATTGRFTQPVEGYAKELATSTSLQVVLIDGALLAKYRTVGQSVVTAYFHDRARHVMMLKRPQVDGPIDEISGET